MTYNTVAQLRSFCNMPASTPADATITYWQTLVDAIIDDYSPSATKGAAIEASRISEIYHNGKAADPTIGKIPKITPLSQAEIEMINSDDEERTIWWE
jgi:hypothetical protein